MTRQDIVQRLHRLRDSLPPQWRFTGLANTLFDVRSSAERPQ
jgi:hypothetical protein